MKPGRLYRPATLPAVVKVVDDLPPVREADGARESEGTTEKKHSGTTSTPLLSALTTYRAHMLLMTNVCILAVDFRVFPRSLAKCETYGASLVRDLPVQVGL